MKALMLWVVLGAAGQSSVQVSTYTPGSQGPGVLAEQELRTQLTARARLLYGPEFAKTLVFVSRVSPAAHVKPKAGPAGPTEESPFTGSDYEETTKPTSLKGDVASGVILLEDKDVLFLDLTPCRANSTVFEFHRPLVKKPLGSFDCNGRKIDRSLVAQR
jgi:hypothetical protein